MPLDIWSPKQLLRRLSDDRLDDVPAYFRNRFFSNAYFSRDQDIIVSELPAKGRKLAPFVLPTEQGKPIAEFKGETMKAVRPPYIKPKDAVRAVDASNPHPDEVFNGPLTPAERHARRVGEVQDQHKRAIDMQIAYMCAKAVIDGALTVKYQRDQGAAHPEVTINFGRASNQTVVLSADYWDDVDTPILDDVETWANRMRAAAYGQFPTLMLVGAQVVPLFKKNKQVLAEMDLNRKGGTAEVPTGITLFADGTATRIGTLGSGIEVYGYRDYVENANGGLVDLLGPKDILLLAPGYEGVLAYGAIYNSKALEAGLSSIDIFPSMWRNDDPGDTFLMHESAPLPYPLYPNRSLKATVLA